MRLPYRGSRKHSDLLALLLSLAVVCAPSFHKSAYPASIYRREQQGPIERSVGEIKLSAVEAVALTRGVLLKWRTSFELDNAGFNVYRVYSSQKIKLNRNIIGGSVFIVGQSVPLRSGYSYSFFDRGGSSDSTYSVEAVGLNGSITSSGQIACYWKDKMPFEVEVMDSSAQQTSAGNPTGYPSESFQPVSPEGQIEDQWAIASQFGLKISISKDGWYRVTHQRMTAAGFNPAVDIGNLQLFNNGRELAILTNRTSGPFIGGDYIEFYGHGLDTATTDVNTYYLLADTTPGKRIFIGGKRTQQVRPEDASTKLTNSVGPLPRLELNSTSWFWWLPAVPDSHSLREVSEILVPAKTRIRSKGTRKGKVRKASKKSRLKRQYAHVAKNVSAAFEPTFDFTVQEKDRSVYFVALLNGNTENFFGQVISSSPVVQTLAVLNPERTVSTTALLEIALQGASHANHVVTVQFNDITVGTMSLNSLERKVQTFQLPMSALREGDNSILLTPAPGSGLTLVDYTRLSYAHSYRADNGSLRFTAVPARPVRIDGFSSSGVRVIDYSDPFAVRILNPLIELNDSGYTLQLLPGTSQTSSPRLLYAFPESGVDQSATLSLNQPSSLHLSTNGADLLILSHKSLISSFTPLVNLRASQGLTVSVIDVEDVYDEFGYGAHGPQAIRDFLAFVSTQWSKVPRYVILGGDASYDPRNYLGLGNRDLVPTKLVDATFNETSSDDWLTDFNNDGIADIPVGRLPAFTAAQASIVVSKIVSFAPASVPQSALLVADAQRTYYFNFEQANTQVQSLLPASMVVERVDRRTEPSDAQASINIVNKINAGQALVNYSGHGNVNTWTDGSIFTSDLAVSLTNGNKLPFVVVMDCLNGYFHEPNPGFSGLAEAFLQAPNGGAVASFASSGLTIPDGQHEMSLQLYTLLYGSQSIALGDAIKIAKASTNDMDVRRTWIFFGDPSMKIR